MHCLQSVEHDDLLHLAQRCVDIGASFGRVNVANVCYGRESIHHECEIKFQQYKQEIMSIIGPFIDDQTVAATADL